jgi:hypothetical protein
MISGAMCVMVPWNTLLTCVSRWSIFKLRPKSPTCSSPRALGH